MNVTMIDDDRERRIFRLQAELCQTLADPTRLEILHLLRNGPLPVNRIVEETGQRQAKISQHLAVMRRRGIVSATRSGVVVYYELTDPRILDACRLIRELLLDQLRRQSSLAYELGAIEEPPAASRA